MSVQPSWIQNIDGTPWTLSSCPNSARVTYPVSAALVDLMDTIENVITGAYGGRGGWELYDASAGSNTRAYRALNLDGSYKYITLGYNTNYSGSSYCIVLNVYESWNATTHVGANAAGGTVNQNQIYNLTTGGDLYLFTGQRYLIIQSKTNGVIGSGTGNSPCGCVETSRDNPEDAYPLGAWVGLYTISGQTPNYGGIALPRWVLGTASNAYCAAVVDWGGNFNALISAQVPGATAFGGGKAQISNIRAWGKGGGNFDRRGILYGVVLVDKSVSGGFLDQCVFKRDANGLANPSGVDTLSYLLSDATGYKFAMPA